MSKERITVSIDADLADAAATAVTEGRADSVSAWVNGALATRVATERRLRALADAVALYEAEHGVIDEAELAAQARADRDSAAATRAATKRRRGAA